MRRILTRAAAGTILLMACDPPTLCGCSPVRYRLDVDGQVRAADGSAAPAAIVRTQLGRQRGTITANPLCDYPSADPITLVADSMGRFSTALEQVLDGAFCVRVSAYAQSTGAENETVDVKVVTVPAERSVSFVLTLR